MSRPLALACGVWGFRNRPYLEHPALAAGLGFRTLEFAVGGGHPGQLAEAPSPTSLRAFRAQLAAAGVRAPFACIENDFTLADVAAHRAMVAKVGRQMQAAAAVGAERVRLFAGFRPYASMDEATWRQLLDAFGTCAAQARALGLAIAVETHGAIEVRGGVAVHTHTVSTHPDGLARLLRELPGRVGINYDPGNLKAVNPGDRTFALGLVNDRVNYCHLKDWRRHDAGWLACAPGDDDLDYAALLPQLAFRGPYLIEYEPLEDTLAGIRRGLEYLSRAGFALQFP